VSENQQVKTLVLDSWAVLAWLQGEAQGEVVRDFIGWLEGDEEAKKRAQYLVGKNVEKLHITINIINLGEIFYILGRRESEQEAKNTINELRTTAIEVLSATDPLVFDATSFKISHAIAYADAFALATAKAQKGTLVTGDPELKNLKEVPILWIGEGGKIVEGKKYS
jgi:predicted nucleic acid-binding protein